MTQYYSAPPKSRPMLKIAGKVFMLVALRYGPAGMAGWAVKSVARRPLKMLLAMTLEPLLMRLLRKLSAHFQGTSVK